MLHTLRTLIATDPDYPKRTWDLEICRRALKGTLYDVLVTPFHAERRASGEYIPIRQRNPSVRYGLCKIVVRDSIALLFGEGRFPAIDTADTVQRELLVDLVRDIGLAQAMTDAAWRGAIGSVAVRMRVLKGRLFVDALDAMHLLPEYLQDAPDTLFRVVEERKLRGSDLLDAGYVGLDPAATYWFRREWTSDEELWMLPLAASDKSSGKPYARDAARTVVHRLGFVPLVWVRNLPGGDDPDGSPTISDEVIRTGIEIDYQLSQLGRGLKYSQDPTLLIKEPAATDQEIAKSAGNALIVTEKGDAKLLEIGGTASAAVLEYVRMLRELALETAHGDRSSPEKLSGVQSGKAMEMIQQPLVRLADDLRTSYGAAMLALVAMIARAGTKYPIALRDGTAVRLDPAARLTLRWPPWFAPTHEDKQIEATTLVALTGAGLLSIESAVKAVAETQDIGDVDAELARIKGDAAEQAKALAAAQPPKAAA